MPELEDPRATIHIRIRDLRRQRSLTQEELADALGISRQSVNAMEAGRCLPSLPVAVQIARYFSIPLSSVFLMSDEDPGTQLVPWSPMGSLAVLINRPAANVYETERTVCVELRVPGYDRDELELEVGEEFLKVSSAGGEQRAAVYDHEEFAPVAFERAIRLPVPVVAERASADLRRGILTVTIPKQAQEAKTSRIRITSGE